MIKTWTLQYFKSVYEKTTLKFAPLTIFSGANSSGKSTIIQSLLLTAQTLQNSVYDRPIILNGHIIKVGSFKDIVSNGHEQENILIGFELSSNLDNNETPVSMFSFPVYGRARREFLTCVNCQFQFSTKTLNENNESSEIIQLQPQLEECKIEAASALRSSSKKEGDKSVQNLIETEEIYIIKTDQPLKKRLKQHKLKEEKLQSRELSSLNYEIKKSKTPKEIELPSRYYRNLPTTGNYIGASLNHFLPSRLSMVFDTIEEEATQVSNFLASLNEYDWFRLSRGLSLDNDYPINKEVKEIILDTINISLNNFTFSAKTKPKNKFFDDFKKLENDFSIDNLLRCHKSLSNRDQQILVEELKCKTDQIKKAIKSNKNPEYALTYVPLSEILDASVDYIKNFFTHLVKYLGPLRDEPKAVYSLAGTTDSKDIGFRGEHTAAVLEVHRKTQVKYIPSEQFELGNPTPEKLEQPLSIAVLDWLKYMGIANDVKTSDKGVLGYELKVAISETQSLHDLTHVGVGVSQVLPILVQSLLAERGSTLIFEQPELHLHPKVQTRLADFFISMTMLNKQCIVETHSEYLINRLRYLSVISQDNQISNDVIIYFVEKQGEKSLYRPVKINEFGVIEDWPKGFFDENEKNSRAIIKAAMEKRKANLQKS
jgi:predicted ATPase